MKGKSVLWIVLLAYYAEQAGRDDTVPDTDTKALCLKGAINCCFI